MYRLESENLVKPLIQKGFDKSKLYVTGNPIYDTAFKKLHLLGGKKNSEKIRVLFAPLQLYENGLWSKEHQFSSIKKVVSKISNNPEILLTIKLHPSSISISDYEHLINEINPNVEISQSGDIIDYLSNSDVIISFPGPSTIFIYALVAHKPIILCNFFNQEKHQLLEENLAIECKKPEFLIEQIHSTVSKNQIPQENIDTFLKENFYKTDGKSSERFSDAIINFLTLRRNN